MSSHQTTNLGLHSWEPEDNFLRTEFNDNFSAIDSALAAETARAQAAEGAKATTAALNALRDDLNAKIVTGTYTGDGTQGRLISLGFTPQAVILCHKDGTMATSYACLGGIALPNHPCIFTTSSGVTTTAIEIATGGFTVTDEDGSWTNSTTREFYYIAIR